MSPCQWQQSELSIGTQCPSLDRLGIYKCWTIKNESPAALVWKNLFGSIITLLEDQYEHLDAKDSELMVEMFMIGRKASSSVPTILFCCEGKPPRQKAMDLVKKKGILDRHPGVRMAESSRLPQRLASGESSGLPLLVPGVYLNGPLRSCGTDVLISRDGFSPPRKATIGGIVCIEDDFYGLTVAHAFDEVRRVEHTSDQDFEFAFYGPGQASDSSADEDDSMMTSKGSMSSGSNNSLDPDEMNSSDVTRPFNPDPGNDGPDSGSTAAHTQEFTEPIKIGSFFESAPPKSSLDWALVKIDNPGAIQYDNQSFSDLLINKVHLADRSIYPNSLRECGGGRVLICLGSLETAIEGTMSGISSFSKVPGSDVFQELWQVSRFDGNFVDGDCGTWVIDFETGDLLGHIISGYSGGHIAYVIPAEQIFRDINDRLGRHVQLSSLSKTDSRTRNRELAMGMFTNESRAIISLASPQNSSVMGGVQPGPPSPLLGAHPALFPSETLVNMRPPPLPPVSGGSDILGVTSGILALAAFAFQSSTTLYNTVQSFQVHSKLVRDLREELEALSGALGSLTETVSATTDVDLSALSLPVLRCGNVCNEFEQEIMKCSSQSEGSQTSFRDFAKLRYMGDDIDGFRQLLAGYRSTINIALAHANFRKSSATAEDLQIYRELINTTTNDLEVRLQSIDEKLEAIFGNTVTESVLDATELQLIKEERMSAQMCFQICAQLSDHINQIRLTTKRNDSSPGHMDPDALPKSLTNEGLQECKKSLTLTAVKLEGHIKDLIDRMVIKSKTAMTSQEELADLVRLREEWETTRQCMNICSKADIYLMENTNTTDKYSTGDAIQVMVSTNGNTIHSTNRGLGWRTRQIGGHMSSVTLQQLSQDISCIGIQNTGNEDPYSQNNTLFVPDGVENMSGSEFTEQPSVAHQRRKG